MATTTKLTATNGYYGHSGNGAYTTSDSNHLYVGQSSGTSNYRARMTFPAMNSLAAVGASRIRISKILLYIRRNDGGPTAITVGCSSSSQWGAALAATAGATIDDTTGWYAVDLTALADAVNGYTSKWYLHITGKTPRLRFSSTGSSYKPYLMVTWEHVAATITGDRDSAQLGADEVTFTITPEVSGETHTLTYALGDSEGTIAQNAGDAITWTPPIELAAEIPDDDTATAEIRMTAYDSAGNIQRTELYYQTVTVPESILPVISDPGAALVNGLSGYGLAGRSMLELAPVIDMSEAYGATIASLSATVTGGYSVQWTSISEGEPGVFTGAAARTGVLTGGACEAIITATDSRGRTVSASAGFTVCAYSPPVITSFSVERYEPVYDENEEISGYIASDLGEYVWVNLAASVTAVKPESAQLNELQWRIEGAGGSGSAAHSGGGGQSAALSNDRTVFPDAVSEDEAWTYTVTVTDSAGGTAIQYATVGPAHANFSLAPGKWGAAVGMIATGTKENPKFEVSEQYRAHFYGGAYDRSGIELIGSELITDVRGSAFSVATGTNVYKTLLTAPETGLYVITCTASWASNADGIRALVLLDADGSTYLSASRMYSGGTGAIQQNTAAIVRLEGGQTIQALFWQNSGSEINVSYYICKIARIGAG